MLYDGCSDLHVDTFKIGVLSVDWATERNDGSEVLVIAGDTANHYDKLLRVLAKASPFYTQVVFLDGNHEHYDTRSTVTNAVAVLEHKAAALPNVTYLNGKNACRFGATVFIGCNGWYDFKLMCPDFTSAQQEAAWRDMSNDSVYIRHQWPEVDRDGWRPVQDVADEHAELLRQQVESYSQDETVEAIIVVTHTAPIRPCLVERPADPAWQALSGAYGNSAMARVLAVPGHKIKHWIYGHTHFKRDFTAAVNGVPVRFINNARGYQSE